MKTAKFISSLFLVLILLSCSDDNDFDKDIIGVWEQSYTKVEPYPYEKLTLNIESENKGSVIQEKILSQGQIDTISINKISKVNFFKIGESRYLGFSYADNGEDTYEIHQLRPKYLYIIKAGELYTFIKK
jgi:hypothetical protein